MLLSFPVLALAGGALAGGLAGAPTAPSDAVLMHASLESSQPAAGDTIAAYPKVLRLVFSEPVETEFAEISITDGRGMVSRLTPSVDPHNVYALIADFPAVPPG